MATSLSCVVFRHQVTTSTDQEYEFVNQSEGFYCPVTFELLLDPHQTMCCGQEISAEVATRLQKEGKACPLCNIPDFTSYPDMHFCRSIYMQKVFCPNKKRGCEWVGELSAIDSHEKSCPTKNNPTQTNMVQLSQIQ